MSKEIQLSQNEIALIDDEDYELISKFKWHCVVDQNGYKYAARTLNNNRRFNKIRMHRFIMNAQLGEIVDHINHNTLDNRRKNLRLATKGQNAANQIKQNNRTSIFKGVTNTSNGWRAYIKSNQKKIHLGYFDSELEAAKAYNHAAIKHFGNFAKLNNI